MQTSLQIDGANCPTCFHETLDALAALDGVHRVSGSIAGPCIEIDHDIPLETITATIRGHLHGVEMFANELRMVPLDPAPLSAVCAHHHRPAASGSPARKDADR